MKKIKILIITACCVAIFVGLFLTFDVHYTRFGIISPSIEYSTYGYPCEKEFPLHITFENIGVARVSALSFALSAHAQDRSTNLILPESTVSAIADSYRGDDHRSGWNIDKFISPFDEISMCYKLPKLSNNEIPPELLVWSIKVFKVKY